MEHSARLGIVQTDAKAIERPSQIVGTYGCQNHALRPATGNVEGDGAGSP